MLSQKRKQRNKDNLGTKLKEARNAQGYTQKALAEELGLEYYTMISQMELGYISIPASLWVKIADVLRMDKSRWVLMCLYQYQPEVFQAAFGNRSINEVAILITNLRLGNLDDLIRDAASKKNE
ncbi:MAG: helix-turn-helix transcriptional regulator [Gammaproteobacteria bacterium]|nr:helix-turn-helix transcriptional regulator [Gammaproteobacteria bacterium]